MEWYFCSGFSHKLYFGTFPMGTLMVNLIGSFVIGVLWFLSDMFNCSPNIRVFAFIGILGGFTTFSSFSLETFNLFHDGEIKIAIINILANNVFGILLAFAGYFLMKLAFDFK